MEVFENTKPATRRPCGPIEVSLYNVSHALNDGFSMAYDFGHANAKAMV